MIRSILRSRQLLQSVRNFSENKTIPPDFIDPKKLSDVIDNAVTSDDRLSTGDQGLRNVDFSPFSVLRYFWTTFWEMPIGSKFE